MSLDKNNSNFEWLLLILVCIIAAFWIASLFDRDHGYQQVEQPKPPAGLAGRYQPGNLSRFVRQEYAYPEAGWEVDLSTSKCAAAGCEAEIRRALAEEMSELHTPEQHGETIHSIEHRLHREFRHWDMPRISYPVITPTPTPTPAPSKEVDPEILEPVPVTEPTSIALVGIGLLSMWIFRRRDAASQKRTERGAVAPVRANL